MFHYVKETHDINSLLTLVKIVLASQHKKQPNKSLSIFHTDSVHYAKELLVRHQTFSGSKISLISRFE